LHPGLETKQTNQESKEMNQKYIVKLTEAICEAYDVSSLTVYNVRKKYDEGGLERAILRKKPERVYERRLDGEGEAHLIALACSEPPEGYQRWSLRLLQDRIIRLEIVENISHETIRQTLKKTSSNLG
jgi:transposase